jgi:hypothetical protein
VWIVSILSLSAFIKLYYLYKVKLLKGIGSPDGYFFAG